jgi:hypothetical protein
VAGLFAGHVLVYRIISPGPLQRAALLAGTGHGYLPLAIALAIVLAAGAAGATVLAGFRRGSHGGGSTPGLELARALIVPALAQAAAFLALETLERALAGAPLGSLLGPLLPIGILLQLAVGAAGGLVLLGLERAGQRVGSATGRHPRHRRNAVVRRLLAAPQPLRALRTTGASGIRGPPLAA